VGKIKVGWEDWNYFGGMNDREKEGLSCKWEILWGDGVDCVDFNCFWIDREKEGLLVSGKDSGMMERIVKISTVLGLIERKKAFS
jgi:hypothetical protein